MALFEKLAKSLWRFGKARMAVNSSSAQNRRSQSTPIASPKPTSQLFTQARHRLDAQIQISQQIGQTFFTSDLSINEYLLTKETGCQPISMVMGTSFYKVGFYGYFRGYRTQTGEVDVLTQAQLTVRELAVCRMQQEAALLGANGIIGVRLHQRRKGWGLIGMIEFTAIGTAIRIPNRPPTNEPFTSDLSGQEFWQLRQAGYYPKGLVFGACSYYVHSDRTTRNLMNPTLMMRWYGNARRNQELIQYTQGFQDARELAITRMTEEMNQLGATGAVGINIEATEEVITYQLGQPWGCLWALLFVGSFSIIWGAAMTGNTAFLKAIFVFLAPLLTSSVAFSLLVLWIITSILINLLKSIFGIWRSGPFRDLLTNFVVIGTAIVEDEMPIQNPVSQTLMYIPLSKSSS
jgi:uncharacterized protein YbjQ (UPF0145 family)